MEGKNVKIGIVIVVAALCLFCVMLLLTGNKKVKQTSYVTYQFETFTGTVITIDEKNIISQKQEKNVLESDSVPATAEVIAPGRDYVYLEDEKYYYVEDSMRGLLTIASKVMEAEE